jgi:hypothetical protein
MEHLQHQGLDKSNEGADYGRRFATQYRTDGDIVGFNRPPPLKTSSSYDDDELFANVSLSMLSRHDALGLSVDETIKSVLISPSDRASFLRALNSRKARCAAIIYGTSPGIRSSHLSPSKMSLVEAVEFKFGQHLHEMVESESQHRHMCSQPCVQRNHGNVEDLIDRMISLSSSQSSMTLDGSESTITESTTATAVINNCAGSAKKAASDRNRSGTSDRQSKKKKESRRFFPDSSEATNVLGNLFIRKRRVRNIDWKLAEAIEHVESLRLDGTSAPSESVFSYEPPSPGNMNMIS